MVIKPSVLLTPLTVFKNILFRFCLFSIIFTNFAFIREICDPESYVPFISNLFSNNSFTLINGVLISFFAHYLNLLLSLNYWQLL